MFSLFKSKAVSPKTTSVFIGMDDCITLGMPTNTNGGYIAELTDGELTLLRVRLSSMAQQAKQTQFECRAKAMDVFNNNTSIVDTFLNGERDVTTHDYIYQAHRNAKNILKAVNKFNAN